MAVEFTHVFWNDKWTGEPWGIHVEARVRGATVGVADFGIDGRVLRPSHVEVEPEFRRRHIATGMYVHAEKATGLKVVPGSDQTSAARAMWASRGTSFGGWGRGLESYFIETQSALEALEGTEAFESFEPEKDDVEGDPYVGRRVIWLGHRGKMVKIPAENILTMDGNQWNFAHAAAIREYLHETGQSLRAPAARIYRIKAADVKQSQKYEAEGELEYQLTMAKPWEDSDVGAYYAQLLDGNHRALAALALGEPYLWVYCGENYLENVRKADLE